jgi:hypothetical protein
MLADALKATDLKDVPHQHTEIIAGLPPTAGLNIAVTHLP